MNEAKESDNILRRIERKSIQSRLQLLKLIGDNLDADILVNICNCSDCPDCLVPPLLMSCQFHALPGLEEIDRNFRGHSSEHWFYRLVNDLFVTSNPVSRWLKLLANTKEAKQVSKLAGL